MEWLNYHHLLYFWTVVREGSIAGAGRKLMVGRPSISAQLKSLEAFLGEPLFERRGRHLELTETGRLVHGYADDIFATGRELLEVVRGRPVGRPALLRVGVADVMAKIVTFRLLEPLVGEEPRLRVECSEEAPEALFARLALHELDLVLSDVPIAPRLDVRAKNRVLGESSTTLFARPALARRLKRRFPRSLTGEPLLMPARQSAIRHSLEEWLDEQELLPDVVGEFEDSALLKVFGSAGHGVFPAPTIVAPEIERQYQVRAFAELPSVRERFYAITPERKRNHEGVDRIVQAAARNVFGT